MRPRPPERYSASLVERAGLGALAVAAGADRSCATSSGTRAAWRCSMLGIALAAPLLVVGTFSMDSIDVMIDTQFNVAQRYDVTVSFVEPGLGARAPRADAAAGRARGRAVPGGAGRASAPGIASRYGAITASPPGSDV